MKLFVKAIAIIASVAGTFISCQKEADYSAPIAEGDFVMAIHATNPESVATKTTMDGTTPKWLGGDKVTVLYKSAGNDNWKTAESDALDAEKSEATFTTSLINPDSRDGYAYYPANTLTPTSTHAKLTIAASQAPSGTAFDGTSDILISEAFTPAASVTTSFARLGAVLRIKIKNDDLNDEKIQSLSVTGANPLVGNVLVRLSDATVTGIEGGSNTVTATYVPAKQFTVGAADQYVYLIVYPQTLSSGSTLTIAGETENTTFSQAFTLSETIHLNPGHIVPLNITLASATRKPNKVFYEERFLEADGTGGNDGSWSGSVASSTFLATGWTATKSYYGKQCARFGNGSNNGNATTPSISIPTIYKDQTLKLYIKAGAWSGKGTTLGLSVDGATPSSTSLTLKDGAWDTYDLTLSSITKSTITVSFTKSDQWFLDAIIVYYGDMPAINPGLAYAEASINKTYGDASFTNTLTNPYSLTVSYTSSEPTVASVNASSGAVTILKAGTTRITASSAAQGDYSAGEAYYDLTVGKAETGLAYAIDDVAKNVGDDNFTNPLTNPHTLAVSYSSTDEDVATVNSDGEVTIKAGGSTIISATFATNDYYLDGEAYYLLTVKKAIKTMEFASSSITVDKDDYVTLPALTIEDENDDDISGSVTVTYSSSNTSIAEEETGNVLGYSPGTATITASISGDAVYEDKNANLTVYVLGKLPVPTGVTMTTLNKAALVASWTASLGAESYDWQLINTSTSVVAKYGSTTDTSINMDYSGSNIPNGTYRLSVVAKHSHASITDSDAGTSSTGDVTSYNYLIVSFDGTLDSYTSWSFSNLESKQTGWSSYKAHGGTGCYSKTSGMTTAYAQTSSKISNPVSLTCYYTKCSGNTNSSSKFIIQVSSNGSSWTNVATGKTMNNVTEGTWEELTGDLSSYSDVYVRVYYTGTTAVRALDDITLTYE